MHFVMLTCSRVWFCRLKDWVLRMIYMLVSAEEEEPWPSPFIQEDWFKSPLTTLVVVFPLDAMSRIRSGNPELQERIFLPSKTQEVKSVPRESEQMQAARSCFHIFGQFLTSSIPLLSLLPSFFQDMMQEYRAYHRALMRGSLEIQRAARQIETCRSICCRPRLHEELYGPFQMKWLHSSLRRYFLVF